MNPPDNRRMSEADNILVERDPKFESWVALQPPKWWARYDLSAVRMGWEAGKQHVAKATISESAATDPCSSV
jgi:hypothetical protein